MNSYKTIKSFSEGIFKDRGSRFLSFAYPVDNEVMIKNIRAELRKKYFDANHHVYAFRIGADKKIFRCSDDGEPANSSGPPILGQIQSFELTNILIVVVRYFGGTKLGIPGLFNAYRNAAIDAIKNAEIIQIVEKQLFEINFQYPSMGTVMHIIKESEIEVIKQEFLSQCTIQLSISKDLYEPIKQKFKEIRDCTFTTL